MKNNQHIGNISNSSLLNVNISSQSKNNIYVNQNNGEFNQCQEVIISANTHERCLFIAKKIYYLCKAWSHNVKYDEYKSARKGDILRRDIMIYQTAYADDIIAFNESLRHICFHYDNYQIGCVQVTTRFIQPKDSRINLLNYE